MTTTTATTYQKSDGTAYPADDAAKIDAWADDLQSGQVFYRAYRSYDSSRPSYRGPAPRKSYAHVIATLGEMAGKDDVLAQLAHGIIARGLPLYQTEHELYARLWRNAWEVLSDGYDDVIRRSGPEPGRYRDHQRDFTMRERLSLYAWLTEACRHDTSTTFGFGWVASALIRGNWSPYWLYPKAVREQVDRGLCVGCDGHRQQHGEVLQMTDDRPLCSTCREGGR